MTELQQYIRSYFGIPKEDLEILSSKFQLSELKKGAYFCKADNYCERLSFVKEGYLRVYAMVNDKEVTQWISTQSHFVTDLSSIVFDTPCRWNIQALTDCTLYSISKKDYQRIDQIVPQWPKLEKLFIAKCFLTLEDRVFSFLSLSAEERYHQLMELNPTLFNQIPLQYLASMLGMTPETLSRIRRKTIS